MPTTLVRGRGTKILLLNPNSSSSMTESMKAIVDDIDLPYSTEVYTYTGPPGAPASIDDGDDIRRSAEAVLADPDLDVAGGAYAGVVVACFSVHPLVPALQALDTTTTTTTAGTGCAVTGIFEASALAALSLLGPGQRWGIVTTGEFWEDHLSRGVGAFVGSAGARFAGVASTGLNASDFHHGVDPAVVRRRLKEATRRLLDVGDVHVIVMGCAGMAGLEGIIRETAADERGEEFAYSILHVIDGVRAGVMQIDHMIRNRRLRPGRKP